MTDIERSIAAMRREPWRYWDRRALEEVVYQLQDARRKCKLERSFLDPRFRTSHDHLNNTERALTELLAVLGFDDAITHPSTQPVGMGEESAP